jgi:hypothetical protein
MQEIPSGVWCDGHSVGESQDGRHHWQTVSCCRLMTVAFPYIEQDKLNY